MDQLTPIKPLRSSFSSYSSHGNNDGSAWERGLDCINSILEPQSATLAALSDEQRSGLKGIKAMMLSGVGEKSAKNHIPQALLDADDDDGSAFLLAEYAGIDVTRRSSAITSMSTILSVQKVAMKLKKKLALKTAMKQLKSQSTGSSKKSYLQNIPPYWFDLDHESQLKLRDLLSWDSINRWDFDIFDVNEVLKGKNTLVFVSWAIIAAPHSQYCMDIACAQSSKKSSRIVEDLKGRGGYNFISTLKIREKTLINFLSAIEEKYNAEVSYHNCVHAADVTQSLHVLLQMGAKNFTEENMELFFMLIAAVVHDVGHTGLNNNFHVNSRSELALVYNDVSVLENMHVSTMFRMIMGENRNPKIDIFENFEDEQTTKARNFITNAVLSTDMKKHFSKIDAIKGIILGADDIDIMLNSDLPKNICLRSEVLTFIIHLADISNPSKPIHLAKEWTDKLMKESFHQGDLEENLGLPFTNLCDRRSTHLEKSQVGFINFVVLPSYELLGRLIPRVESEIVPRLLDNLKYWQEQDKLKTVAHGNYIVEKVTT